MPIPVVMDIFFLIVNFFKFEIQSKESKEDDGANSGKIKIPFPNIK